MPTSEDAPSVVVVRVQFSTVARAHDDGWLSAVTKSHDGHLVEVDGAPSERVLAFADFTAAEAFCADVSHDGRFDVAASPMTVPVPRTGDETADSITIRR